MTSPAQHVPHDAQLRRCTSTECGTAVVQALHPFVKLTDLSEQLVDQVVRSLALDRDELHAANSALVVGLVPGVPLVLGGRIQKRDEWLLTPNACYTQIY